MVLLAFVGGLVAIVGAEFVLPVMPEERATWWPWIAYWFLLVADVLTLGIATAIGSWCDPPVPPSAGPRPGIRRRTSHGSAPTGSDLPLGLAGGMRKA
jgi:hypothetical protein